MLNAGDSHAGKCNCGQELFAGGKNCETMQVSSQYKKEYVLSKQLLRSGTGIGANVAEAQRGQSRADFLSKMSIALKEANETQYWLKLLLHTDYLTEKELCSIHDDLEEVLSVLTAICKTSVPN